RLDAHVHEPHHGARRVVGVQGREHEVPSQARLHRDLRGLEVADLAYHDHVRVLAQNGPQRPREGQLDARIHLGLDVAVAVVYDRVLDGDDVGALGGELAERGVEGGRVPGAG